MKKICTLFIGIIGLFQLTSCSSGTDTKQMTASENPQADSAKTEEWFPEYDFDTLRGLYSGDFGDGFITVFLTYVNGKKAIGYNILKGLQRNISGDLVQKKDAFELTLSEPGDNPYDGVFVLNISKKDFSVTGTWTAKDPSIKPKKFKLKKQVAKDPLDGQSFYEGESINESNFLGTFGYSTLDGGNIRFEENGLATFTYYPDEQKHEQLETIKASWRFENDKTLIIEWAKNTKFKERNMKFKLLQPKDEVPSFQGPNGLSIDLEYY